MDQASGGEDPNKPSKKKSNEDEGKNKKLVGIAVAVESCHILWSHRQGLISLSTSVRPRKLHYLTVAESFTTLLSLSVA